MANELTTDARAFLNIGHPLCAWATYRGMLVSPPVEPGFLSVWSASRLSTADPKHIGLESALESVRREHYPHMISRLTGMFCFLDLESAERACAWGARHFRPEYLAELNLKEADERRDRLDARWLSKAPLDDAGNVEHLDWAHCYWRGESCGGGDPIWETLVQGRATVLGTDLRKRAYSIIQKNAPDSLMFLEIARLAAWIGSDLGNLSAFLREYGEDLVLAFYMDMQDAKNEVFLAKLRELIQSGHPVNHKDMKPHLEAGNFGRTPDLTPFGFRRPKNQMPYVGHTK